MNRRNLWPYLPLNWTCILAVVLAGSVAAAAQTVTASRVLTPAQQKAQAASAARKAAAQQAAQNRSAVAQNRMTAAQNKSAANITGNAKTATPARTGSPTAATSSSPTNPSSPLNRPGASTGSSAVPANSRTTGTGSSGTVGSGTLNFETRVYSSSGCVHNGNSAVCTFTFVNQGNEANLVAGRELAGLQLVDDAEVPHNSSEAHFQDKYGTQQPRLIVKPGDSGTYVVTFPNVNAQVTSGDFHLRQQTVGGVTFNAAASTQKNSAALPSN
jgi:hypothetical protein